MNFKLLSLQSSLALTLILITVQSAYAQYSKSDSVAIRLVQSQLDAYNKRDIELFLEPYKDSIKVFRYPRIPTMKGKSELRKNYEGLFRDAADLHCELVNRMVLGNTIIDHERVTQFKDSPPMEVFAIYRIWDGLIEEVTFLFKNQP